MRVMSKESGASTRNCTAPVPALDPSVEHIATALSKSVEHFKWYADDFESQSPLVLVKLTRKSRYSDFVTTARMASKPMKPVTLLPATLAKRLSASQAAPQCFNLSSFGP